jgi:hypothetical protein
MASSGKRKTTMAKLMREAKLRERKVEKGARKQDRRRELEENPFASRPIEDPELASMGFDPNASSESEHADKAPRTEQDHAEAPVESAPHSG